MLYQIRSGNKDTFIHLKRYLFSNYTMSQGIEARNVKILGDIHFLTIQCHRSFNLMQPRQIQHLQFQK